MNAHFHDLKTQMKQMQDGMRKNLTKLTLQTDHSSNVLKKQEEKVIKTFKYLIKNYTISKKIKKGKQILRLSEMCRKLETEEEKILPFYASSLSEQEENDLKQALLENPGQDLSDV